MKKLMSLFLIVFVLLFSITTSYGASSSVAIDSNNILVYNDGGNTPIKGPGWSASNATVSNGVISLINNGSQASYNTTPAAAASMTGVLQYEFDITPNSGSIVNAYIRFARKDGTTTAMSGAYPNRDVSIARFNNANDGKLVLNGWNGDVVTIGNFTPNTTYKFKYMIDFTKCEYSAVLVSGILDNLNKENIQLSQPISFPNDNVALRGLLFYNTGVSTTAIIDNIKLTAFPSELSCSVLGGNEINGYIADIGSTSFPISLNQFIDTESQSIIVRKKSIGDNEFITISDYALNWSIFSQETADTISKWKANPTIEFANGVEAGDIFEFDFTNVKDVFGRYIAKKITFAGVTQQTISDVTQAKNNIISILQEKNPNMDFSQVSDNIVLPETLGNDISIQWKESTDEFTITTDGVVNRPQYVEDYINDKEVTIKGIITKLGYSQEFEISFIVKMIDPSNDYFALKDLFEEFDTNFVITDNIITNSISFPTTVIHHTLTDKVAQVSYEIRGKSPTTDVEANATLNIIGGNTTVTRLMAESNGDRNIEIIATMSLGSELPRVKVFSVVVPHKNLLSDTITNAKSKILTDSRPTQWISTIDDTSVDIVLSKKMVFNKLNALGNDYSFATFSYASKTGDSFQPVINFPFEASIIRVSLPVGKSITEVEGYTSPEAIAIIDINNLIVDTNISKEKTRINLPGISENGTRFSWSSSEEQIIDEFGGVYHTTKNENISLTVKAIYENGSDMNINPRSFEVLVEGKPITNSFSSGGGGGGSINVNVPIQTPKLEQVNPDNISNTGKFVDMKDENMKWAVKSVHYLESHSIINGKGNNEFKPNDTITRDEFVKIIAVAFDLPKIDKQAKEFIDVDKSLWYWEFIDVASRLDIVGGDSENFGVGKNITRQDIAVIISRTLQALKLDIVGENSKEFLDTNEIKPYAIKAIGQLVGAEILGGYSDNTIRPSNFATRAEASKIIYNTLDKLNLLKN